MQPSDEKPPDFRPRWFLVLKRVLRYLALGAALVVVLLLVAMWMVNLRGAREWEATRKELVGRGERLTTAELVRPTVEDERNFFGDPMWREIVEKRVGVSAEGVEEFEPVVAPEKQQLGILGEKISREEVAELKEKWPRFASVDFSRGRLEVLLNGLSTGKKQDEAWQADWAGFSLAVLRPAEPLMEKTRELLKRPEARFPVEYQEGIWARRPHLGRMLRLGQAFSLRARAEVRQGHSEEAARDVLTGMALSHVLRDDPFMLNYIFGLTLAGLPLSVIEKGIASHAWSEGDLEEFEAALRGEDVLPGLVFAMRGDRAATNDQLERLHGGDPRSYAAMGGFVAMPGLSQQPWWESAGQKAILRGYIGLSSRSDQAIENRLIQKMIDATQTTGWVGMNKDPAYRLPPEFENMGYVLTHLLTKLSLPAIFSAASRAASVQDQVVQARLAIGLERYYLAQKEYPETLEALVPTYLAEMPMEVLTGKPMHYKRPEAGAFLLWAEGWDGKDGGGKANERHHLYEDDWVWGAK